jgi:outer membrane protein assembly factor BamB
MCHKWPPAVACYRLPLLLALLTVAATSLAAEGPEAGAMATALRQMDIDRGLCAVAGLPVGATAATVVDLARESQWKIYFQSLNADEAARVREAAAAAGLLGTQIFVDTEQGPRLHLAENLADAVLVAPHETSIGEAEVLRVLHPDGVALLGTLRIVKPCPPGTDSWSHVFHSPDNNPLSADQAARAPYLTHFLAAPLFCPMPEVSVAAGGRVFRAFGHIAHKANQNALLNTLLCINGYNGTILWQRPLHEGFMIHRNTLIATADTLYLGDDESCKLLDARSGRLKDQIVVPAGLADGPVWKWMALQNGRLYALVGGAEVQPATQPSTVAGLGHWPWGMWQGHDYKDTRTNFGFGRTLLAIDPATKQILWRHSETDYIDARGVCMRNGHIYFYCPGKHLACIDAATGRVAWKNADRELLDAIGRDGPAQLWVTGYATTTFIKCTDRYIFFAGPQRKRLVAASTTDGKLVWQKQPGNLQLVLRDDAIYAAGEQNTCGLKLAYATGETLSKLPARRACTRATGTVDSVFFRTDGGTMRLDMDDGIAKHIAPMRPPCQDGVIVSDGLLYWGPWMCGCQLSLYGHICLGPAERFDFHPPVDAARLTIAAGPTAMRPFSVAAGDWPNYLHDGAHSGVTEVALPERVVKRWSYRLPGQARPTAPIAAGGLVFVGDSSGAVRAIDTAGGSLRWQACTAGAIFFPPTIWRGRLFVGSADGHVYAYEAATGRLLWTFRAAPAQRWIPVYGRLMSTWPVAGGVVVVDGVVYAAAGIAHYDGTYVYALDAASGRVLWCNDSSGVLSSKVDCGISLQGPLYLAGSELRFLGGGKYETARFDRATGKCLNAPNNTLGSQFRTAFEPYFPEYGRYMSLDYTLPDGKELLYDASYEGSQHSRLTLFAPLPAGVSRPMKQEARWPLPRQNPKRATIWSDKGQSRFQAFAITPGKLLAAGQGGEGSSPEPFLEAIDIAGGGQLWRERLPAAAVKAGTAIDSRGQIIVALENGEIADYAGQ